MSIQKKDDPAIHVPNAKIKRRPRISIIWLVPLIAAIVAGWLVFQNVRQTGPSINILFTNGDGLQPNQTIVKYRGVRVGEVHSVKLAQDLRHVEVQVRLNAMGGWLAREGSLFWIVRPEVGASGLHGLETIVSGPYIQIQPGNGKEQKKFIGADEPPVNENTEDKFEVIVTTPQINTLSIGSPIYYRGIEVGAVSYFGLSGDSTMVNVHLLIDTNFAPLVRTDSKFWNAGGISVSLKFLGVNISAENVKSLIIGGIAFATPAPPGELAPSGSTFPLNDKAVDQWLKWSPSIPIAEKKAKRDSGDGAPSMLLNDINPPDKQ